MVVRPEMTGSEKYTLRMLSGNTVQGLLAFQDKMVNGEVWYYYDITSKQPLRRVLEHRMISGGELRTLITDLLFMLRQLERYLLDEGQICLLPEYVYVDPGSFKSEFCLVPGRHRGFNEEMCEFSQYLLDHVNQSDGDAVVLAFSVFRECRKLNFGIEDIERCLKKQEKSEIGEEKRILSADKKQIQLRKEEIHEDGNSENMLRPEFFEPNEREEKEVSRSAFRGILTACVIGLMVVVPVTVGVLSGVQGVYQWKWILLVLEVILFITLMLIQKADLWKDEAFAEKNIEESEEEPWVVYFQEEEESDRKETMKEEPEIETILLSARTVEKGKRCLVPVHGESEIPIGYFPFLIGKSKELTDYCLNRPGVSRLHVKIEETKDGYTLTDLNSTNGTFINGVLVEANATAGLVPGDEVAIADESFYFR